MGDDAVAMTTLDRLLHHAPVMSLNKELGSNLPFAQYSVETAHEVTQVILQLHGMNGESRRFIND
jgi:hypothetical protein